MLSDIRGKITQIWNVLRNKMIIFLREKKEIIKYIMVQITPRQVLDQSSNVKDQSSSEETSGALKELQKQFESYRNERMSNEK